MSQYKFVIGITGSISAYKSCELISLLKKEGHQVRVIMTKSAEKFIGRPSLEALSGHPVAVDDFESSHSMKHIEWGKWCDASLVYPTSAQRINSLAAGVGHELLKSRIGEPRCRGLLESRLSTRISLR